MQQFSYASEIDMKHILERVMPIVACCVCLAAWSSADATFTGFASVQIGGVNQPGVLCNTGNQIPSAECNFSAVLSPSQGGAFLQAIARGGGDASGLHAYASVNTGPSPIYPTTYEAASAATAALFDAFHFGTTGSAFVDMTVTTHGSITGTAPNNFGLTELTLSGPTVLRCDINDSGSCTVHLLFNLASGFSLQLFLLAEADVQVAGSAISNFEDTAFVSSLLFTDLSGHPLNLSYTTDSGLTYPMAQANPAPEPGSLALLFLGLASLTALRWTSRRSRQFAVPTTHHNLPKLGAGREAVFFDATLEIGQRLVSKRRIIGFQPMTTRGLHRGGNHVPTTFDVRNDCNLNGAADGCGVRRAGGLCRLGDGVHLARPVVDNRSQLDPD